MAESRSSSRTGRSAGDPAEPHPDPLRDELARLRAVFDLSGDAIFILDEHGHFVDANPVACARYGYGREEIRSLHIGALDVEAERHLVPDRMARILKDGGASFLATHLAKDGRTIPEEINSKLIVVGGRRFFLSICRDVSERLRAEAEQRALEARMQQAQKLESLGLLAGGVAHDFNNLLMGILGHLEVALADSPEDSPVREDLLAIEKAARRAADLSHQMLAYSGRGRFVIQPFDVGALVEEMGRIVSASMSKKVALRFTLAETPPVLGDVTQFRQVAMNLLLNAAEAIGDRDGTIAVSTGRLDRARLAPLPGDAELPEGEHVWLEIADDGCGMEPATLARVFDPFFTTKFMGRGLGLAAVQGIVRSHKGAIEVRSEPGKGTTFRVLLPVAAAAVAAAPEAQRQPTGWRGHGLVLLADDEELVRTIAGRVLERLGFEVLTAADGEAAVALFTAHQARVRCTILDLTMPRLDGEEALHAILRLDPKAKVILASGYEEPAVTRRFEGKGLAGFLHKPFRSETLAATLEQVLG
jgi:PAS domain S-box-containing protein